jgi:hypothetical protein
MPRRTPKYCRHRATGQAYVTLDGREHYLGVYGSPESRERYDAEILPWRRENDVTEVAALTVGQLCLLFIEHADQYYRRDGQPTGEAKNFREALKPLSQMFRGVSVLGFGPQKLDQVRQRMIERGHVRTAINKNVCRIRQVFKWGVSREVVPAHTYTARTTLPPLRQNRSQAREPEPITPVPEKDARGYQGRLPPVEGPSMTPEQKARQEIDRLLADCGWLVQDYKALNLAAAPGIAVREFPLKSGFADYLLYLNAKAAGIIEAKPEGTALIGVEPQSDKYSSTATWCTTDKFRGRPADINKPASAC